MDEICTLIDQLKSKIEQDHEAKQALRDLESATCNPAIILLNLLAYGSESVAMKAIEKDAAHSATWLLKLSERLIKDADDLKQARAELEVGGIRFYGRDWDGLPDTLKKGAALIKQAGEARRHGLRRRAGRNKHLVFLVYYIQIATGTQHYREVADLLSIVERKKKPKDAEAVRKLVDDFAKEHAWAVPVIKLEAELQREADTTAVSGSL